MAATLSLACDELGCGRHCEICQGGQLREAILAHDIFTAGNSDMSEPLREDGQLRVGILGAVGPSASGQTSKRPTRDEDGQLREEILAGDQLGVRERRMLEVGQIRAAILGVLANLAPGRTSEYPVRDEDGQLRKEILAGDQLGVRERRMLEVGQIRAAILGALDRLAAKRTSKRPMRNEDGQLREEILADDQLGVRGKPDARSWPNPSGNLGRLGGSVSHP